MTRLCLLISVLLGACGGKTEPAAGSSNLATGSCANDVDALGALLTALSDPENPPVAAPWPTGDAERDRKIEARRAQVREALKPSDPSAPAAPLAEGIQPGLLDEALAGCQPALDHLQTIAAAEPDRRRQAWVDLADAIGACDCAVDVPLVRAALYMIHRGPE